jgi:hypothetical protein
MILIKKEKGRNVHLSFDLDVGSSKLSNEFSGAIKRRIS